MKIVAFHSLGALQHSHIFRFFLLENTLKERSKGLVAFETLFTIPTIVNLDS